MSPIVELLFDLFGLAYFTATGGPTSLVTFFALFVAIDVMSMRYSTRLDA